MLVPTRNPPHSNFKFSTGIWLFMVVLLLAACDTLSSRQCKTVDWRKLGLMDALSGRPITRIKLHAEACKKVEIEPDLTAWSKGYELGRDHYCQPKNAYDVGRGGNTYLGICIPEQHAVFVPLYRLGRKEYHLISKRNYAANELENRQERLDDARRWLAKAKAEGHQTSGSLKDHRFSVELARERYHKAVDDLEVFRRRLRIEGMWKLAGLQPR